MRLFLIVYLFFMHSYTSVNLAPRATAGHLRALSVPGPLANFALPGGWDLPTPGPPLSY